MGGSGGSFPSSDRINSIKDELKRDISGSLDQSKAAEYDTKVNSMLNDMLTKYNDRDVKLIQRRLDELKKAIGDKVEDSVDTVFGGSVSKNTFIDGLSDVDSLVVVGDKEHGIKSPEQLRNEFAEVVRKVATDVSKVEVGKLAVTVRYKDGSEIQLLPALRTADGFKISSASGTEWSKINPKGFAEKLTSVNKKMDGKLVPCIKLIKGINGALPEAKRLSGYHVESLAINAFRDYKGDKYPSSMISHFFNSAKTSVLSPIRDSTGQSVHVDGYLGAKNSEQRKSMSYQMDLISRKINNARRNSTAQTWKELFGE